MCADGGTHLARLGIEQTGQLEESHVDTTDGDGGFDDSFDDSMEADGVAPSPDPDRADGRDARSRGHIRWRERQARTGAAATSSLYYSRRCRRR